MRNAFLFLGISMLLFGCLDYFRFEPAGQPQPANETPPAPEEIFCIDSTPAESCSSTKPFYCTKSGGLVEDPEYCGCPPGTILLEGKCSPLCPDGTAPDSCSASKPKYCTHEAMLIDRASVCGCPEGKIISGEACASSCSDGTRGGTCSQAKPMYCTMEGSLVEDPARCGCPEGSILSGGYCISATCIDGTPAGQCAAKAPNYCDPETISVVSNPGKCGCNYGRIPTPDGRNCVSPRTYYYREDEDFRPAPGLKMMARNSAHMECEKADYIILDLSITNEGMEPISFTEAQFPGFQLFAGGSYKWLAVEYPINDSECSEVAKFPWNTTIQPGERAAGIVWYKLLNWRSDASYYIYYSAQDQAYAVKLHP